MHLGPRQRPTGGVSGQLLSFGARWVGMSFTRPGLELAELCFAALGPSLADSCACSDVG